MGRITILGRSGKGKTWFHGYLLEQMARDYRVCVHYDIQNDESGLSHPEDTLLKTLPVNEEIMESGNLFKIIHENQYLRIVPEGLDLEQIKELGCKLADVCYQLAKKYRSSDLKKDSVMLSIDESHMVFPNYGELDERLSRMCVAGRKMGLEWILSTQRSQKLHETAISQADYRCLFGVSSDRDVEKINNSTSFDASQILGMEKYKVIIEDGDAGEYKQINTKNLDRKRPHVSVDDGVADKTIGDLL